MKQLILIGLLTCLGVAQMQVTPQGICACQQLVYSDDCNNMPGCTWNTNICVQQTCSTYTVRGDCLKASKYCQWNGDACGTFAGCSKIQITTQTDYQLCRQTNVQCAAFDGTSCQQINSSALTTQCSDYSDTYCTSNVGSDGVCVWNKTALTCGPITLCTQATQSPQCAQLNDKNGLACQWQPDTLTCTQITNCGAFGTQASCKYYLPSLTSPNLILCQWTGSACVSATNSRYLANTNCLTGTGYNYRWVPTASDPTVGICASCKTFQVPTVTVLSRSQCQCSQYILSTDCNTTYCAWNAATSTCGPIACSAVKSQSVCSSLSTCQWDFANKGACTTFDSCSNLPIQYNSIACAAQSIYCAGFSGGACTAPTTQCSDAVTQSGCQNWVGTDGVCKWSNGLCSPLKNCQQILDPVYCGSWQNLCEWNATLQLCEQLTCATYNNNQAKCVYVLTGFQQSDYQLCRYNTASQTCQNAQSGLSLTSTTCAKSTASTYRWSSTSPTVGFCVSCTQNPLLLSTAQSCQCTQFSNQIDCNNSGYCTYSGTTCSASPCSGILNQLTCASISTCQWNGTTGCTTFTGCSNLTATNQLECAAQNASCKGFTGGQCSTTPNSPCALAGTACSNVIGSDGICYQSGNACLAFSTCTGATQTICDKNPFACYWNTTNAKAPVCQPQTCSNFKTQLSCKFYVPSPVSVQVIPCSWNATNNTCSTASEIMTQLTSATCVSNTHSTYRWINTNGTSGYCVKCQQQLTFKSQCPCTYLMTSTDCGQASECIWTNSACQPLTCSQIYMQSVCSTQTTCAWVGGTCVNFSSVTNGCASLIGSTQFQCVSQQSSCVGTNGTNCTNILNTCESYQTATACVEQFGSDGICYWENTCLVASNCSNLSEAVCNLKANSCYYKDLKCNTLTCADLTVSTCTYVVSLTQPFKIQTCQVVGDECANTTDIFQLSDQTCYSNTARTSRWIPLKDPIKNVTGICQSCSRSLIPAYNIGKCQCYQFITQADCIHPTNSCTWTGTNCAPLACSSITTQLKCASTIGCGWTISETSTGSCGVFDSCSNIKGTTLTLQNCLAYSATCRGFNGGQCTQQPTAPCSQLSETSCADSIGNDGLCQWNTVGTTCVAINTCSQISNPNICTFYANACSWSVNTCQAVTCASLTTPATCDYVITSFVTGAIQLCQWNSTTRTCSNLNTYANLNSANCAQNSAFTHRWVPKSQLNLITQQEGYCASCILQGYTFIPGQCTCNQVFSSEECLLNPSCSWNTNSKSCYNTACSAIVSQYACSTNPRCAWSESTQNCQPFTSCSDLAGVNAAECFSYSTHCGNVNTRILRNDKYVCATPSPSCVSQTVGTATTATECENRVIEGGICYWQTTTTTPATSSCVQVNQCDQIAKQYICLNLPHSCFWGVKTGSTTPSCQQTTCAQLTRATCGYYFTTLGTPSSATTKFCSWSAANNACVESTSITNTQLTQSNCYSSTLMMSRWSSATATPGYCASCSQYAATYAVTPFCKCSQLSQTECALAAPYCTYNTSCVELTGCTTSNSLTCSSLKGCVWTPGANTTAGTCAAFTACSAIKGPTSPLQCLQATVNCPVYTSTNTTSPCSASSKCSSFNSEANCSGYNQNVAAGYCYWNASTSQCQTINNCGQIIDVALCGLQTNRCQWSAILNSCITQTCSSYTSQSTCTFIYTSYTPGDIALCQWNTETYDCRSAPLSSASSYTDPSCFVNTGHTYHMDGTSCVQCFQTFLSALFVILLMLV